MNALALSMLVALAGADPSSSSSSSPPSSSSSSSSSGSVEVVKAPSSLPPGLAGRWQLDLKASTDLTSLIDRLGGGFLEKEAAKRIAPVHEIRATATGATIQVKSAFQDEVNHLVFDGKTAVVGTAIKMASRSTHLVVDDAIVSTTVMTKDGESFVVTTTRRREGSTMTMTMTVADPSRPAIRVKRVFRALP